MEFITEQEAESLIELGIPQEISDRSEKLVSKAYAQGLSEGLDGTTAKIQHSNALLRERQVAVDVGRYAYRQFMVFFVLFMVIATLVFWCAYNRKVAQQEIASCYSGRILACQEAVINSPMPDRQALLRTAYKDGTGKELPNESQATPPGPCLTPGSYDPETGSRVSIKQPGRGDSVW